VRVHGRVDTVLEVEDGCTNERVTWCEKVAIPNLDGDQRVAWHLDDKLSHLKEVSRVEAILNEARARIDDLLLADTDLKVRIYVAIVAAPEQVESAKHVQPYDV
jgi:hypothetical protein